MGAREKLNEVRLYALLTEESCRRPWQATAELLLSGGVDAVQLREKDLDDAELLSRAHLLRNLTAEAGALFIVNDRPDLALLSEADGVHLGQDDLPPGPVRSLVGGGMLVGISTHSVPQARAALSAGADYIGVGPVAPTSTKNYPRGMGPDLVRSVCAEVDVPAFAIGGIDMENVMEAVRAGATGVAVCSVLCGAEDPEEAARRMRAAAEEAAAD